MSAEIEQIVASEAIESAARGTRVIDVREKWEWDGGHAPGSLNMPMSELQSRYTELPVDETLLVICQAGSRSLTATQALAEAGYHVINVDGGMYAWSAAGGEVVVESEDAPSA